MRLITAIIRPEKLEEVKTALFAAEVTGMTILRVAGHGGEKIALETYRGAPMVYEFHEKIQLEIAVSGEVGDGKIFVRPLEQVIRIRTGELDNEALTPEPMRHH